MGGGRQVIPLPVLSLCTRASVKKQKDGDILFWDDPWGQSLLLGKPKEAGFKLALNCFRTICVTSPPVFSEKIPSVCLIEHGAAGQKQHS